LIIDSVDSKKNANRKQTQYTNANRKQTAVNKNKLQGDFLAGLQ